MIILLRLKIGNSFAQTDPDPSPDNLTPNGVFDNVSDQFGNLYRLEDLLIPTISSGTSGTVAYKTGPINCNPASYFNLFYDDLSGFEPVPINNPNFAINAQRRAVICKVFQDIAAFINSPLNTTGNKVNIWFRNINGINGLPNGRLAVGSSYYNITSNAGLERGIADGEIWETIHTGVDSYANIIAPIGATSPYSTNGSNLYHGYLAIDFNNSINWNLDTTIACPAGKQDLYTYVLREAMHALGIVSLITKDGTSRCKKANFQFFSRYDTFLKDASGNIPLIVAPIAAAPLYDNDFNTILSTNILSLGCTLSGGFNSGPTIDNTICSNALKYVGAFNTLPVYTPICYENGRSLSHFEDQCFASSSPGNNNYFAMCNINLLGVTRRYLKPEERNVLCDIGYSVNTTYGVSNSWMNVGATTFNYVGSSTCAGITVAGVNDGVNSNGTYAFIGDVGQNIVINGSILLGNDVGIGANGGFRYLYNLTENALLLPAGTASTNYTFNSTTSGLHVLRYIPTNGTQFGNITYVFVFVKPAPLIAPCVPNTNPCDFVLNGDFEQFSGTRTTSNQLPLACGWENLSDSCDYFVRPTSTLANTPVTIPCNAFGYQDATITGVVNNRYAGFGVIYNNATLHNYEILKTRLKAPLIAGVTYQLTFEVSLADKYNANALKLQAYIGNEVFSPYDELPIINTSSLKTNNIFTTNVSSWDKITFTYTPSTSGEQYLYLGPLNNVPTTASSLSISPPCSSFGGAANGPGAVGNGKSYYYIDNVSLIPLNGAAFNLPNTIACPTTTLSNLMSYIVGAPTTGVFSGQGVQFIGGVYSFNPIVAGAGLKTITYTYNNGTCIVQLVKNITVTVSGSIPIIYPVQPVCAGSSSPLQPYSNNGISGTWSPIYNSLASDVYKFTPTGSICPTNTMTVTVIQPSTVVANNDNYTINYPTSQNTVGNILGNDTLNSNLLINAFNNNISIIPNTAQNPTFTTGGISFDAYGNLNILANTPSGTYTLYYNIKHTNICIATSNQGVVTITINPLIIARANFCFYKFCYSDNAQISLNSVLGATASECPPQPLTIPAVTIGGVAANASNISIYPVGTLPTGFSFNPDGTVNVAGGTLPVFNIPLSYRLCPPNNPTSPNCTGTINARVSNASTISAVNNIVRFNGIGTNTYPGYGNNVLANDSKYSCSSTAWSPATNTNVILTQLSSSNSTFSINSAGFVVGTSYLPGTTATLTYQICDSTYPNICGTATVDVCVCPPPYRMANPDKGSTNESKWSEIEIVPNPSDNVFNINFIDTVKTLTTIEVYNMLGQTVFKDTINDTNTYSFDASNLPTATYILKLSNENEVMTKKLLKN